MWQRQRLQAAYTVRRVRCVNVATSQMIVVVVGTVVASYWGTTAATRATRPIAVGAFVSRPPLHMCVIAIVGTLFAPTSNHSNHDDGTEQRRQHGHNDQCQRPSQFRGFFYRVLEHECALCGHGPGA